MQLPTFDIPARPSSPKPHSVRRLPEYKFGTINPEFGKPMLIHEVLSCNKDRDNNKEIFQLGDYHITGGRDLCINNRLVPQWGGSYLVLYPGNVVIIDAPEDFDATIHLNPHINSGNRFEDGKIKMPQFTSSIVTNETKIAYVCSGKIITRKLSLDAEVGTEIVDLSGKNNTKLLGFTSSDDIYYIAKEGSSHSFTLYRNNERVGDIPTFRRLKRYEVGANGVLILDLEGENGVSNLYEVSMNTSPRYRSEGIDHRIDLARRATERVLRSNGDLKSKLAYAEGELKKHRDFQQLLADRLDAMNPGILTGYARSDVEELRKALRKLERSLGAR